MGVSQADTLNLPGCKTTDYGPASNFNQSSKSISLDKKTSKSQLGYTSVTVTPQGWLLSVF